MKNIVVINNKPNSFLWNQIIIHHCETTGIVGTYGAPEKLSTTGISQGGYSNNIIVTEHFAIKIPGNFDLQYAAPLLCAGITTYSPMMQYDMERSDK